MKDRYFRGVTKTGAYHPKDPILRGALFAEERLALNEKLGKIPQDQWIKLRDAFCEKAKKSPRHAPNAVDMHLNHGDMIVMNGTDTQKYFEVRAIGSRARL